MRKTALIITLVIVLFFPLSESYSSSEDSQPSINEKINAIFGKNRIYKVNSDVELFFKSATSAILQAKLEPETLFPENRFILRRPTDPGDSEYYGPGITVLTYDSQGGNFKIHYTEDNTQGDAVAGSDGDPATIPWFIIELSTAFEEALVNILSLGFSPLPGDNGKGGDNRFDVYIRNLPGSFGYTSYDEGPSEAYIIMDNDFAKAPMNLNPEGRQKGAIKVTAAHELFHAFQLQYTLNIADNGWWMEATATWMEDAIFPEVKDYLNYIGSKYDDANDNGSWDAGETYYKIDGSIAGTTGRFSRWFDKPELPLNYSGGGYEYGGIIWVKYLSKTYGSTVIKSIWDRIGSGFTAVTAMADELKSQGSSLAAALKSFRVANYTLDYYLDGKYYPMVRHEATFSSYPAVNISQTIDHLSSRYYAFKTEDASTFLILTFTNMNSGNMAVKLVMKKTAGGYDTEEVVLNGTSVIKTISNFGKAGVYSEIVVVLINISPARDDEVFIINASINEILPSSLTTALTTGSGGGGGGCFIATAAYGSYLSRNVQVLSRFRDSYLLTNPLGKTFVRFYYKVSPPLANYIRDNMVLRIMTRIALTPVVFTVMYPKIGLLLIALLLFYFIFLTTEQRSAKSRSFT